jgi:hypothetical protein
MPEIESIISSLRYKYRYLKATTCSTVLWIVHYTTIEHHLFAAKY